jgi:hypothetical protein
MSDYSKEPRVAVISRYDVGSLKQHDLAAALDEALEQWISKRPGFVSGAVYSSIDALHVITYTQWDRREDGINYLQCPQAKGLWEKLQSLGTLVRDSHTYWIGENTEQNRGI